MEIRVRPATEADFEAINALRRQVNDLHVQGRPDIFKPGFCGEMQEFLHVYLNTEEHSALVAEADGQIAGFAMVDYTDRPESPYNLARRFYHVSEIGVSPHFQRQGVASALTEYMKKDASERGFPKIELDVWEFNQNAIAFYEAQGFTCYRRYMELPLENTAIPANTKRLGIIHLICGMICSGKSTYAKRLARERNAVILSSDDLTAVLPCDHDASYPIVHEFMRRKAAEIARCGADVILDWGFWNRSDREEITQYFRQQGLACRWYYMDTSQEALQRHIEKRNAAPTATEFPVDEGLLSKCLSLFEPPAREEMDGWVITE